MIEAIARLIRPQSKQAPDLSPLWISVTRRAFRAGGSQLATARMVVKFDDAGDMHFHKTVDWRPFTPGSLDHQESVFALFDGGKLHNSVQIDGAQWSAIDSYGLERFLMEAAASRDFRSALAHVAVAK